MNKNIIKTLIIAFTLFISTYIYSNSIAVVDYKVASYSKKHSHVGSSFASLITTRFAFSSPLKVVSHPRVKNTLRAMGIGAKSNIGISALIRISKRLGVKYIITGEIIINFDRVIIKSKLLKIGSSDAVILSKTFITIANHNMFNLANAAEETSKGLAKDIFKLRLFLGKRYRTNPYFDIMFIIDTTSKMHNEVAFLEKHILDVYSRLIQINPAAKIRIGVVDFKTKNDAYRARLLNFTNNINKVKEYIKNINTFGGDNSGGVDISYALYYGLVRGNWRSPNRFVYIITSGKPADVPSQYRFSKIIKKAKNMGIKINVLGASSLPLDARDYYNVLCRYTGGRYHDIVYKLAYYVAGRGKKSFVYKHHFLYMLKRSPFNRSWMYQRYFNNRNTDDITLGRLINSVSDVKTFLLKEGFRIRNENDTQTLEVDTDIDYIITNSLKSNLERTFVMLPRLYVKSGNSFFYIYINTTRAAYDILTRRVRRGSIIYIGAHIKPSLSRTDFDIDPESVFFTRKRYLIANDLIAAPSRFSMHPSLYSASGIFKRKIWFFKARVIRVYR